MSDAVAKARKKAKAKKHGETFYANKVQYRAGGPWEFYRSLCSREMPELWNTEKCARLSGDSLRRNGYADVKTVKVELRER